MLPLHSLRHTVLTDAPFPARHHPHTHSRRQLAPSIGILCRPQVMLPAPLAPTGVVFSMCLAFATCLLLVLHLDFGLLSGLYLGVNVTGGADCYAESRKFKNWRKHIENNDLECGRKDMTKLASDKELRVFSIILRRANHSLYRTW